MLRFRQSPWQTPAVRFHRVSVRGYAPTGERSGQTEGKFAATGARSDKIRESSARMCASIVRIAVKEHPRKSCGLIESRSGQIGERFEVIIVNSAETDVTCVMIDATFAGIDVTRGAIDAVMIMSAKLGADEYLVRPFSMLLVDAFEFNELAQLSDYHSFCDF